jgi:nucleoside-diphosphate-sugar epimerase
MNLILITGCSGRLGKAIIERFRRQGVQIVGFDVVPPAFPVTNFEFVRMDLMSKESIVKGLEYVRQKYGSVISSFVHLAGYYSFDGGRWEMYQKLSIEGTQHLLERLKTFHCEQFLFSSSMLAMQPCPDTETLLTEESPMSEAWEYPKSKKICESYLFKEHGDIPLVVLRIAGCYDDECHSIPISNQIQRIYEHQLLAHFFPGNKKHGAAFIHLDDVAEVVFRVIEKRKELAKESIFMVAEEDVMSFDELQKEISELINGREISTFRIPKLCAKIGAWLQNHIPGLPPSFIKPWMIDFADDHYAVDISRLKRELSFEPRHLLRETLPVMIKFLLHEPAKFYKENGLTISCKVKACCGR